MVGKLEAMAIKTYWLEVGATEVKAVSTEGSVLTVKLTEQPAVLRIREGVEGLGPPNPISRATTSPVSSPTTAPFKKTILMFGFILLD